MKHTICEVSRARGALNIQKHKTKPDKQGLQLLADGDWVIRAAGQLPLVAWCWIMSLAPGCADASA